MQVEGSSSVADHGLEGVEAAAIRLITRKRAGAAGSSLLGRPCSITARRDGAHKIEQFRLSFSTRTCSSQTSCNSRARIDHTTVYKERW